MSIGARPRPRALQAIAAFAAAWTLLAGGGAVAGEQPLHVSVAISLRPAIAVAVAERRAAGGPEVLVNAAGSGVLVQQVRRGAPTDLLISASPDDVDRLVDAGLARPATRLAVASNRLVVLTDCEGPGLAELVGLSRPEFDRIAIGNPRTAPVGRYAREALETAGVWSALAGRLVMAENARQVVEYVARGDAPAGVAYETDARLGGTRVCRGPAIPAKLHRPIVYEGIVPDGAARPEAALALLQWLGSGAGRAILAGHGFAPPPAAR